MTTFDQQVSELNEMGLNDREIAEQLGVGRTTVHAARMRQNIGAVGRAFDWDRAEQAAELYRSGQSAYALAKVYGVAHTTILEWVRKCEVPVRSLKA